MEIYYFDISRVQFFYFPEDDILTSKHVWNIICNCMSLKVLILRSRWLIYKNVDISVVGTRESHWNLLALEFFMRTHRALNEIERKLPGAHLCVCFCSLGRGV